jgi:hypothetical protein
MTDDDLAAIRARAATTSLPELATLPKYRLVDRAIIEMTADVPALLAFVDEQAATIARLTEALRWYADALRYGEDEDGRPVNMDESSAIENDSGARARAALVGAPDGEIGA